MVRRGDSLWHLAHRQLGSGTRWPEIYNEHNKEAAKPGQYHQLMRIIDENLIFVGQKIVLPPRPKILKPGGGTKAVGDKLSIPLDLKVSYTIGRDTPPILYIYDYLDFTIKTELRGEIGLEIMSDDMRRHSLELIMSKNPMQAKQKLNKAYDPALCALTAKPEMVFESGKVKIKAPIATEANLGAYIIDVQAQSPNHMSGTLKPPTLSGTVKAGGCNYKFSADIELKAEVIWHPKPKGMNEAPLRDTEPVQKVDRRVISTNSVDWSKTGEYADKFIAVVTIVIITIFAPSIRMSMFGQGSTTSIMPFSHTIDPRCYGHPRDA